MHRLAFVLLAALLGLAVVAPPAGAKADANAYTRSQAYFPSRDGTMLHAFVYRPAALPADAPTPVLLQVGPYSAGTYRVSSGNPDEPVPNGNLTSRGMFARGYTFIEVDLRGYGSSAGCADLGGPGEQADARAAVEWAASQPWSNGRVGMVGGSYPGWTQLMAAADPPDGLVAIAPVAALSDFYSSSLFTNGVGHQNLQTGFALTYLAVDLLPGHPTEGPQSVLGPVSGQATQPGCGSEGIVPTVTNHDRELPYYQQRDLRPGLQGGTIPVFVSHGFVDFRVRPSGLLPWFAGWRGPRQLWIGQWGHGGPYPTPSSPAVGRAGMGDEMMAFFDRYVRQVPDEQLPPAPPAATVQDGDGGWRAEEAWPPADARLRTTLELVPGSYLDIGGYQAEPNEVLLTTDPEYLDQPVTPLYGEGAWTFSEPFPHEAHLAGEVSLSVSVDVDQPDSNLVANLYEVDAEGNAAFIARGAYLVPEDGTVGFELHPQDWRVEAGHRLAILFVGSDQNWWWTNNTGGEVRVVGGSMSVPWLLFLREEFLEGTTNPLIDARQTFVVDAATIEGATGTTTFPPRLVERGD